MKSKHGNKFFDTFHAYRVYENARVSRVHKPLERRTERHRDREETHSHKSKLSAEARMNKNSSKMNEMNKNNGNPEKRAKKKNENGSGERQQQKKWNKCETTVANILYRCPKVVWSFHIRYVRTLNVHHTHTHTPPISPMNDSPKSQHNKKQHTAIAHRKRINDSMQIYVTTSIQHTTCATHVRFYTLYHLRT